MSRPINIPIGTRFGAWTVVARAPNLPLSGSAMWVVVCDCGTRKTLQGYHLRVGHTKGCWRCFGARRLGVVRGPNRPSTPRDPRLDGRGRSLLTSVIVLRHLYQARWTARQIAADIGISYRTAYRVIRSFRLLGLEVQTHREGREVYHRLDRAEVRRWLETTKTGSGEGV